MNCPCCSGKDYAQCCAPYHKGLPVPNALALMRSRYSAYALKLPNYIMATTHPENASFDVDSHRWCAQILHFCETTQFHRLEILEFIDGEETAYVTFIARLFPQGFQEKSRFDKLDDRWLYRSCLSIQHI